MITLGVWAYPPQETLIYSDSYETLIIAKRLGQNQALDLPFGERGMAWEPLFYNRINHAAVIAAVSAALRLPLTQSSALINLGAYLATGLGMYFLALAIFKKTRLALLAALLVAVSPSILFWKSYLVGDPLAIALLVWSLLAAVSYYHKKSSAVLIALITLIALTIAIRLEYVAALPAIYLLLRTHLSTRASLESSAQILLLAALPYAISLHYISDLTALAGFSRVLIGNWSRYLLVPLALMALITLAALNAQQRLKQQLPTIAMITYALAFLASRDWASPLAQLQYFTSWLTLEFGVITAALGYLIIKFKWSKETVINRALLTLLAGFSLVYFDFYFQHAAVLTIPLTLIALISLTTLINKLKPQKQSLALIIIGFGYTLYSLTLTHFITFPKFDFQQVEAAHLKMIITTPWSVVYTGFPQALYYLNNYHARYLENSLAASPQETSTYVVMDRKTQVTPKPTWEKVTSFAMPKETLIDEEGLPVVTVYKVSK
jgi:hypothetical protein